MFILKRLSLAAALLTLAGCAMKSDQPTDHYYDDDFSMEAPQAEVIAPAEKNTETRKTGAETAKYASNSPVVSEVSKKVAAIEARLRQIQKNIKKDSQTFRELKAKSAEESGRYYEHIARIRARLQNGTTPGNPELVEMWKQASALLAGSDKNMAETAKLSSEAARAKNEIESLLETIRETFSVPGAVEIDHENLKLLEDEANQTVVSLNRLSSDLTMQITRQQQYFSSESQNINLLSTEIQNGSMTIGNRRTSAPAPATSLQAPPPVYFSADDSLPEADLTGRRPLMIIRFNKPKVDFEQPLYKAVKAALDKRQSTHFEIVAVSPANSKTGAAEAAKKADSVREALLSMGLPASRIYSSQKSKTSIKTTEVHLYLK